MTFSFHTTCVSAAGDDINAMKDIAKEITYRTMLKHCSDLVDYAVKYLGYNQRLDAGLTLKADWAVSYHKSFYQGVLCYYFVHSGIEHIWVKV